MKGKIIIDIPRSCDMCELLYDCMECSVTGTSIIGRKDIDTEFERLPDCPIIPINETEKTVQKKQHGVLLI